MSKGDCQYTGKICYHAGLPESWNCSPKSRQKWNLKVAVFNFSPPIFLVSCSSQPLVHITSLKLVLSGFLPVKANAQFSVLILLDLVIGLRWLFFPSFITGLPGHHPTLLWLLLPPWLLRFNLHYWFHIIFLTSKCWGYQDLVHGCLLRSLVERPHCFKYHPLIIHLHTCITSPSLFPKFIYPAQHLKLCSWCAPKNLFFPLSSPFQFLSFLTFCCFRKKMGVTLDSSLLFTPHQKISLAVFPKCMISSVHLYCYHSVQILVILASRLWQNLPISLFPLSTSFSSLFWSQQPKWPLKMKIESCHFSKSSNNPLFFIAE